MGTRSGNFAMSLRQPIPSLSSLNSWKVIDWSEKTVSLELSSISPSLPPPTAKPQKISFILL